MTPEISVIVPMYNAASIIGSGRRIVLREDLQGKHLKEWRLKNLLHTDIFRRAIPWSRLMLERKQLADESQR
jgi:hypothetical protein